MGTVTGNVRICLVFVLFGAMFLPADRVVAIENRSQWDAAFRSRYPERPPVLEDPGDFPAESFAWHGHYWVRAYTSMAETYGDTGYLDRAVTLIDHMLRHRDDVRASRGELDVRANPYDMAPLHYMTHPGEAAPGWRKFWNGQIRVDVVTDGMISQSIMRFVALVSRSPRFSGYLEKAEEYRARVEETVSAWDDTFAYGRFEVPGSYWYPREDGNGLSSTEVPFNHSAVMAATLLLLDRVKGGVPEYRKKAGSVLDFWRGKRRDAQDDAYVWNYYLVNREFGVEDFGHSHMDMTLFTTAFRGGLMTGDEMERLANTLTGRIYRGDASVAAYLDGSGSGDGYYTGIDWIDLVPWDRKVLEIAKEVFSRHYAEPTWARPFLGWAEILRWNDSLSKRPSPPGNARITDE